MEAVAPPDAARRAPAAAALRMCVLVHPGAVATLAAMAVLQGAVPGTVAALLARIIDLFAAGRTELRDIAWLITAVGVALLVAEALPNVGRYVEADLERRVTLHTREQLYASLTSRPELTHLEDPATRDRLRMAEEASRAGPSVIVGGLLQAAQSAISVVGLVAAVAAASPVISLILPLMAVPQGISGARLSRLRVGVAHSVTPTLRREIFYANLLTDLAAAKELRLFGSSGYFRARMLHELQAVQRLERWRDRRVLSVGLLLSALTGVVALTTLVMTGAGVASGALAIGAVAAIVLALTSIPAATGAAVQASAQVYEFGMLFEEYLVFVRHQAELPPGTSVEGRCQPAPTGALPIRFDHVWFRYSPDLPWVLRDMNLEIPAGDFAAIVGPNGAGKSTLAKLIFGFYTPTRGTVLVGGIATDEWCPEALWERLSAVFQDFVSYEMTVSENIAAGAVDGMATLPDINLEAAATAVGLHDKITAFPAGYDTVLSRIYSSESESEAAGVLLSGGEWQRLAIARALARGPRSLVLFDEPTSWLDPTAQRWFLAAVRRLTVEATSVLITHRMNLARQARTVIVVSEGTVQEVGPPDELLEQGGVFARLVAESEE